MAMIPKTTMASGGAGAISGSAHLRERGDAQFMLLPVTGNSGGKTKKTVVSAVKHSPTMLHAGPKMGPTAQRVSVRRGVRKRGKGRTGHRGLGEAGWVEKVTSAEEEEADGDRVRDVEEDDRARQDGVERGGRAEVWWFARQSALLVWSQGRWIRTDQPENDDEHGSEDDRIDWDTTGGVHACEEGRERQAAVAGEGVLIEQRWVRDPTRRVLGQYAQSCASYP